jgi:hypothetical protein
VTFPCIYVLQPDLFHSLYFSPFYLTPLLMVISTGLKILYSILNITKHKRNSRKKVNNTEIHLVYLGTRHNEIQ